MKPHAEIDAKKNFNGCDGSLFSNRSVSESPHFLFEELWRGIETEMLSLVMAIIHLHFLVSAW